MKKQISYFDLKTISSCLTSTQKTQLRKILILDDIHSTNDYLLAAIKQASTQNSSGWLCLANSQNHGRGRQNKSWFSPPGNICFSLSWCLTAPQPPITSVSIMIAGIVLEVLHSMIPTQQLEFKWPNDVLVNGRKIAGILVENRIIAQQNHLIIGLGLNINLPDDKLGHWSCLREFQQINNRDLIISNLLAHIINGLLKFTMQELASYLHLIRKYDTLHNQLIVAIIGSTTISGTSRGINELGELMLIDQQGKQYNLSYGQVSVSKHNKLPDTV